MASITDFVSGAGFPNPLDEAEFDDNMADLRLRVLDHTHPAARTRSQVDDVVSHEAPSDQKDQKYP